jgi:superfamily II DNA or RNA helicase
MTQTAKIKLIDEVNCNVIGIKPEHYKLLHEHFGYYAPNYFFQPTFKLGKWDGKIRFFHVNGKTFNFLIPNICKIIKSLGYKISVQDLRVTDFVHPPCVDDKYFSHIVDNGSPIILRDYQVAGVNAAFNEGSGIILASTGSGKTIINATIVDGYGKLGLTSITIVPSQDLVSQTVSKFEQLGLDVGEYSGTKKDIDHLHVVSTWQALKNVPILLKKFKVLVMDECHGLKGNVVQSLLNEHGSHIVHRFGLTGTMPKHETDSLSVKIAIGKDVIYTVNASDLIEQGHLATLHIDCIQLEEDFSEEYQQYLSEQTFGKPLTYIQFKDKYFPDYQAEKRYLQSNKSRIKKLGELIINRKSDEKSNILVLVDGIKYGERLQKEIPDSVFVYGKDSKKARRQVYDTFATENDVIVIATVNIAGTGLDIPRIFNLVVVDGSKSYVRSIQTIGRVLRKAHDKNHAKILDICSDLKYSKRHLTERTNFYRDAKYPFRKQKIKY